MVNLRLYQRWQELMAADPEYAAAERGLTELLEEQQAVYAQRVFHAVAALDEVNRRDKMSAVRAAAVTDGIRALRTLDTWHLAEVAASRQQFYAATADRRAGERARAPSRAGRAGRRQRRSGDHRRARRGAAAPAARLRPGGHDQGAGDHLVGRGDGAVGPGGAVRDPSAGGASVAGGVGRGTRRLLRGAHLPPPPSPAAHARPVPARPAGAPVQGLDVSALRRRCPGRPDRRLATAGRARGGSPGTARSGPGPRTT